MSNNTDLKARIANLESTVDMLEAELIYLNEILVRCGFSEGITTLKATVEEILAEDAQNIHQEKPTLF
jgi:hypothetical protein